MNRLDQVRKLLKEQLREIESEQRVLDQARRRVQNALKQFETGPSYSHESKPRAGFKMGVSKDVTEFFEMQAPDTWLTLDQVVAGLAACGSEWGKETVRASLNKGVTKYGRLIRQGDPGSYRYARYVESE